MRLRIASWTQNPAGSLPNDDKMLFRLGRWDDDQKHCQLWRFKKARDEILQGWVLCSDGKLYHPLIARDVKRCYEAVEAKINRHRPQRSQRSPEPPPPTDEEF